MNTTKLREIIARIPLTSDQREVLAEIERLLAGAPDASVPASRWYPAHRPPAEALDDLRLPLTSPLVYWDAERSSSPAWVISPDGRVHINRELTLEEAAALEAATDKVAGRQALPQRPLGSGV